MSDAFFNGRQVVDRSIPAEPAESHQPTAEDPPPAIVEVADDWSDTAKEAMES